MIPPDDIRSRLRRALGVALKARDAGTVAGLGAGEAQRRLLTEADADAIVRHEAAEREAAAGEYERGGRAAEAARLREGARALMAVLGR